jgi:hypothetical protein
MLFMFSTTTEGGVEETKYLALPLRVNGISNGGLVEVCT